MRIPIKFLVLGGALAASPALAQVSVGVPGVSVGGQGGANVGAQTGVGVGVNPGSTVGTVTGTLDRTVDRVDRTANRALDRDLRVATGADLTAGATVRDNRGHSVGVVQSVSGNVAVVARGGRTMHVPLSSLYRSSTGLVTNLSRAQLDAMANANAEARAHN